ncbi:MAG: PLP-dependent aminotransferase family protein [Oscillospiraceae bacterium]|nr:PLP-dependent aminotransferase family protein [Oscillospiraceae bacterium]
MNYTFSDNISSVKPSAIREILKLVAANPSIISLSLGSPSSEAIPVEAIHEISEKLFRERPIEALQYSVTEGYTPLREITKQRLRDVFGIDTTGNEVIITTGGQQGLYMTPEVLINRGDTVIVESPSFVSGIIAMKSNGANVVGIEMDDEGIRMDLLEEAVRTQPKVKLLYLIPSFQNPRGSTMSLQRRRDVYELCKKHGIFILEDNPYGELRFRGEDVPTIKSMDTEGLVIYNGSYSKVLSAGMRIGIICAPTPIIQKLIIAKQGGDCHTNIFFQMVCDEFFRHYDVPAHIEKIRGIYRDRCDFMLACLDKYVDPRVTWTRPDGGLFLWCSLPEGYDSLDFATLAANKGVAFVPGCSFMVNDSDPCPAFRLNYSTPSKENIDRGIRIMAEAIDEYLK